MINLLSTMDIPSKYFVGYGTAWTTKSNNVNNKGKPSPMFSSWTWNTVNWTIFRNIPKNQNPFLVRDIIRQIESFPKVGGEHFLYFESAT